MKRILTGIVVLMLSLGSFAAWGRTVHRAHRRATTSLAMNFMFVAHPDLRAQPNVSLQTQNAAADLYQLPRALTQEDYDQMIQRDYLVHFPKRIECVVPDTRLASWLVVLSQNAIDYITKNLAPAFCGTQFDKKAPAPFLVISSLTRTSEYQRALARRNRNAAAALGDDDPSRRSSHCTGFTFDISARGLTRKQLLWMGSFLSAEKQKGNLVEAIFEASQYHFHVMVAPPMNALMTLQ